jgi:hemin uptake protein HemP
MTETAPVPAIENVARVATVSAATHRLVRSEELFGDDREVLIAHGQEIYRLRLTRSNKLILHK